MSAAKLITFQVIPTDGTEHVTFEKESVNTKYYDTC